MKTPSTALARNMWVGTMAGVSTIASLLLACATPFPSLAALAATHVSRRDGLILMFVAWFAAQAVILITHGMGSMAWPFALATAAVASLLSADAVARSMRSQSPAARMSASYAAAFIGFKLGILAWVALLDHGWSAFSGEVLLRQFVRYGAIFAGLLAVQVLLARAGFGLGMPANEPKPQAA
ncbi:hypothetical protein [Sphingopyxis panaciterrulae]|uniref:Uncharacterized protein n=1 Tax=Sphingopyxis panaciterrulae TaxID=462372 RepID=A0A7W9ERQ3_9SPHN|nr:hypothetical protein [Sphingopyxis panaciterrulae]MBB5707982.1 hypothetical protein [Sphingopyxis panaciterrulae]